MTRIAKIALICIMIAPSVVDAEDALQPVLEGRRIGSLLALPPAAGDVLIPSRATGLTGVICYTQPSDDSAIEAGREALSGRPRYPWYDAEKDAVERIDVKPPEVGFWEWFWDLFPDWNWSWGGGGGSGGGLSTFLQVLAYGLITVIALVLVFFLVRAFIKQEGFEPISGGGAVEDEAEGRRRIEALPFKLAPDMSNLLDAARHYRDQGEFGEAVKYLFSYQLVQLDRYHLIRMTRGKTNRQYLRELGRGHNLRPHVEETMKAFEDFFFGDREIRRPRFEDCWSRVSNFDTQLTSMYTNGQNGT